VRVGGWWGVLGKRRRVVVCESVDDGQCHENGKAEVRERTVLRDCRLRFQVRGLARRHSSCDEIRTGNCRNLSKGMDLLFGFRSKCSKEHRVVIERRLQRSIIFCKSSTRIFFWKQS